MTRRPSGITLRRLGAAAGVAAHVFAGIVAGIFAGGVAGGVAAGVTLGVAMVAPAKGQAAPDERSRILSLGPWPPAAARDAGNAWAGRPAAIELGQQLFFEPRLSSGATLSCASCHRPERAFADGRPRSQGRVELDRNAPSLWNAVHERWLAWDGAADSLWSQSLRAMLDARELASQPDRLRALVAGDPELSCRWRRAFGAPPPADDDELQVRVAKAIGAFVGTLVSAPTPFDRYRDALARGDARAAAGYPAASRRGLQIFVGRGRCHLCHGGPRLSHGEFADIGAGFFVRPGVVDPGRHGGIVALRGSAYNLLGRHADAPGDAAVKTAHVELQHRNFGEFKIPSLRNVALTGPYLHDGRKATLAEMVRHYSELDTGRLHADGERILEPLRLSDEEQRELLAFLESLSDPRAQGWRPKPLRPCPARTATR